MPWNSGPQPAPAWLYTRGAESVRIEVRDNGSEFGLLVYGPGRRRRILHCADRWAVIECQIAQETHLLALGYALEQFTADRRQPRGWGPPTDEGKILEHRERTRS